MLEVAGLTAFYGRAQVLRGVDLRIGSGEIVSLLGRNGSGRSTTVKAIMGAVDMRGRVEFKGESIVGLKSHHIARRGLGYVPENRDIFSKLTVEENLILGVKPGRSKVARWALKDMYDIFPRLEERKNAPAGALSGGEQQMLTMSRTLMGDPDLIMIDEPTEGLAPRIVEQVGRLLTEISKREISVLLIEQKLTIALDISDRVYLMGHGAVVYEGTPAEFCSQPELRTQWLEVA